MTVRLRIVTRVVIDGRTVRRAYERGERQALVRAAAMIRASARRRMRKRSRASRPGEGPTVKRGQLKRFLLFDYEGPAKGTAVIGPMKLAGARGDTPEALERGKTTMRWVGRRSNRRRASVTYEPRPSTMPALAEGKGKLPGFWRGAVR